MVTLKDLPKFNNYDQLKEYFFGKKPVIDRKPIPLGQINYDCILEEITIWYHSTPVVTWTRKGILLNCGGWRTVTTKRRMNQFLPSQYHLYQKDGLWFVFDKFSPHGVTFLFSNRTLELPYVSA